MQRPLKEYAIYQGDTFIMIGTADECAKELNVSKETIYYYSTPSHKKRAKETHMVSVKLD